MQAGTVPCSREATKGWKVNNLTAIFWNRLIQDLISGRGQVLFLTNFIVALEVSPESTRACESSRPFDVMLLSNVTAGQRS